MRRLPALAVLAAAGLALTACTDASQNPPSDDATGTTSTDGATTGASGEPEVDLSGIEKVDEIAAMLPAAVAEDGTLDVGVNLTYAPAEFVGGADGQTPVGYDIDLAEAIALVLGLDVEIHHAEFASIIPAIGSRYDIGLSSFTITPERLEQVNMISNFEAGSAYAVAAGNPADVDPENICGTRLGVQTGTYQDELTTDMVAECEAAGETLEVLRYSSQSDVTTNLVGGRIDVMYADSPVIAYAISQTDGQAEQLGEVFDSAPQGIAVSADDAELTEAVQAAVQHLMDSGEYPALLEAWGNDSGALTTAELNPAVEG
ncbi:ABC transporter substrate-binding protein [Georgenia faecalis]|uniref:ABC transporter substrate-binding protein n=1 Tax=Georgenia faecalis TaxID=2483799 RepID=A0ABV9DDF3_9MICO|nr:ABC transporter substrate-binding protein [Georgenia faecalis]